MACATRSTRARRPSGAPAPSPPRLILCAAAAAALLAGCGGSGQARAESLRAACRDGRRARPQVGPIRRLADVAPSLRRVIAVEREARATVGEEGAHAGRLSGAIAAAERLLTLVEKTEPLLLLRDARELVGELCQRAAA